jgi:hypothetical protein
LRRSGARSTTGTRGCGSGTASCRRSGKRDFAPEAFFDLDEYTLVYTVLSGKGQHSGVESELPVAAVVGFRNGLIVYYRGHIHREDALRELGVSDDELQPIYP